jgi:hypothetical protein
MDKKNLLFLVIFIMALAAGVFSVLLTKELRRSR